MITSSDMEKQSMKASKPAMEKRRRARINESLQQLKALVIDGVSKNNSRHSKLEKADILEMTVRYLRNVQRQQMKASVNSEPIDLSQYRSGFAECIGEVSRCGAMDENPDARARLLGHLAGLCTTQQSHRRQDHQPIRYAVVAPGQMQPPPVALPLQPTQTPVMSSPPSSSSPQGLVAMNNNTVTTMATSVHQPMQMTFPSPPLSNGRHVTQPSPHMNSLSYEGTKIGCGPQVLPPQGPSAKILAKDTSDAQAPSIATPESSMKPSVVMSPPTASNQTPKPTGDVITLILPSQSLPGGQVPTHLIPVYAQEANKGISKPHGIAFPNEEAMSKSATPMSCNNSTVRSMPVPSPKSASTVPTAVSPGQPATWTAIHVPTAQLISPQVGCVAPQFAITIPCNSNISPIGLAVQDKQPTGPPPLRFPSLAPDLQVSVDYDSMWRPW